MKVTDILKKKKPVFSFEFFLPKSPEAKQQFQETLEKLKPFAPDFVSLTYGAGGSARAETVELAGEIKNKHGFETMMHLTCVAHSKPEIAAIVKRVKDLGIENILALRGDLPKDAPVTPLEQRDYRFATDLIKHLKGLDGFCLGVAGYPEKHPEAPSKEKDLEHLKEKVAAGADFITTQLFFDNQDYFDFVDKARAIGITLPIIPGIMPITNVTQVQRFSAMCGAKVPAGLLKDLESVKNDPRAVIDVSIRHAVKQCKELLAKGAPGIHFYTLNRSAAPREILKGLKS